MCYDTVLLVKIELLINEFSTFIQFFNFITSELIRCICKFSKKCPRVVLPPKDLREVLVDHLPNWNAKRNNAKYLVEMDSSMCPAHMFRISVIHQRQKFL